jgi:hypothetical protein
VLPLKRSAAAIQQPRRRVLSERQQRAIELPVGGSRDAEVAERLRLDKGALSRWRRSPRFRNELSHQRRLANHSMSAMLREGSRRSESVSIVEWVPYMPERDEEE